MTDRLIPFFALIRGDEIIPPWGRSCVVSSIAVLPKTWKPYTRVKVIYWIIR